MKKIMSRSFKNLQYKWEFTEEKRSLYLVRFKKNALLRIAII